jgi:hypothetical protein
MAHDRPIKVRGHTLLCLQGFRGEGYSVGFVENLAAIHQALRDVPTQVVEVRDEPDAVCGACPHHIGAGCTLNGPGSETAMRAQDRDVLSRLDLRAGMQLPWSDILDRIRARIAGSDLFDICGQCRWLPLGYCAAGLARLRDESASPSASGPEPR